MKLVFSDSQTPESFTVSSLSQFNDRNQHALIRELIQNSLDASRDGVPAEICMSSETVNRSDIPCLQDLESALDASMKEWQDNPQTDKIGSKIKERFKNTKVDLLIIRDNGNGLNSKRMNDILCDGASRKDSGSAGSYGNGHMVTFKFSGFLYVLYVGVSEDDKPLISGHTILASHRDEQNIRKGKDGYLVEKIEDSEDSHFKFYNANDIKSKFIQRILSEIQDETGYGSAVVITDFELNNEDDFARQIQRLTSLHFFPAILDNELSVSYSYDGFTEKVNAENVGNILKQFSEEKKSKDCLGGPRGNRTYQAYLTYSNEHRLSISTSLGNIICYLRCSGIANKNINLFRKGMWISQKINELDDRYFDKYEAFDLLINVKYEDNKELYDLIKASEGSLHMHLEKRHGHEDQWDELKAFWGEFREQLKAHLNEKSFEEFTPDDFAMIDFSPDDPPDSQGSEKWVRRRPKPPPDVPKIESDPDNGKYFRVFGDVADIDGQAKRLNAKQIQAKIMPRQDIKYPELRVAEVLGTDASCETSGDSPFSDLQYCEVKEVIINGEVFEFKDNNNRGIRKKPSAPEKKEPVKEPVFAVRLNELEKNKSVDLVVKFNETLGDPRSRIKLDFVDRTREMESQK